MIYSQSLITGEICFYFSMSAAADIFFVALRETSVKLENMTEGIL